MINVSLLDLVHKKDVFACTNYEAVDGQVKNYLVDAEDQADGILTKLRRLSELVLQGKSIAAALEEADRDAEKYAIETFTPEQKKLYSLWKAGSVMPTDMTWTLVGRGSNEESERNAERPTKRSRMTSDTADGKESTMKRYELIALAELFRLSPEDSDRIVMEDVKCFQTSYKGLQPLFDAMLTVVRMRSGCDHSHEILAKIRREREEQAVLCASNAAKKQMQKLKSSIENDFDEMSRYLDILEERLHSVEGSVDHGPSTSSPEKCSKKDACTSPVSILFQASSGLSLERSTRAADESRKEHPPCAIIPPLPVDQVSEAILNAVGPDRAASNKHSPDVTTQHGVTQNADVAVSQHHDRTSVHSSSQSHVEVANDISSGQRFSTPVLTRSASAESLMYGILHDERGLQSIARGQVIEPEDVIVERREGPYDVTVSSPAPFHLSHLPVVTTATVHLPSESNQHVYSTEHTSRAHLDCSRHMGPSTSEFFTGDWTRLQSTQAATRSPSNDNKYEPSVNTATGSVARMASPTF